MRRRLGGCRCHLQLTTHDSDCDLGINYKDYSKRLSVHGRQGQIVFSSVYLTTDLTRQFLSWGGVLVLILSHRRTFSENPKIYLQFSFQVEKIYIVCGNLGLGLTYFGGDVCEEEARGI